MTWNVYNLLEADKHLTTTQMSGILNVSDRMVKNAMRSAPHYNIEDAANIRMAAEPGCTLVTEE